MQQIELKLGNKEYALKLTKTLVYGNTAPGEIKRWPIVGVIYHRMIVGGVPYYIKLYGETGRRKYPLCC